MTALSVNGKQVRVSVEPEKPLLWVVREDLGLPGTKFGCGKAQCGACTVHLDGAPVRSCVLPCSAAEGRSVVTIEGVKGRVADAVIAAWTELDVPQCGYCQSGQVMTAIALLTEHRKPTDAQIENAMVNLCRCGTYNAIKAGVRLAANKLAMSKG